eukprot:COSAG06_NODE_5804_length_3262_cov_2.306161_3_plen_97_part_00
MLRCVALACLGLFCFLYVMSSYLLSVCVCVCVCVCVRSLWPMLSGRNLTSPRVEILFTPLKSLRPEPPPPDPLPIVPGKPGNYLPTMSINVYCLLY